MPNRPTDGIQSRNRIQYETTTEGRHIFREYWIHEWDGKGYDVQPLEDLLLTRFRGRTLTYDQIEEESWEAPFVDKHCRTVLKAMEEADTILVNRVSSKRTGLKGKDRISFL